MHTTIRALLGAGLVVAAFGVAVAKLPPPPPLTDAQKAEKAAKDKATTDAAKAALERAEDKAVANYRANQKGGAAPPSGASGTSGTSGASGSSSDSGGGKSLPAQPEKASNAHSPPKK
jgi:hypothetical protein